MVLLAFMGYSPELGIMNVCAIYMSIFVLFGDFWLAQSIPSRREFWFCSCLWEVENLPGPQLSSGR
jgi:hypothetical protein